MYKRQAGALGGMGSSVELLGMYQAFTWTVLPGLGFTGALMAMLGKNDPIGVLIAAFGISYLRASAQLLANDLPYIDIKMISIVEVILTLLISSQFFLRKWRSRQLLKAVSYTHLDVYKRQDLTSNLFGNSF